MKHLPGHFIPFALDLVLLSILSLLFPPCTLAADRERTAIEAMMLHPFAHDLVALMLPIPFTGISSEGNNVLSLSLVDAVYCRTEHRGGAAKFLGILYPGESQGRRIAPVLREEDCHGPPHTILKRLIANPEAPHWIGFVELDVKWTPWQVQFIPTKLQAVAKSHHPKVDVRLSHDATSVYPTSFTIPAEHGKLIPVHFSFGLAGNAIVLNGLVVQTPPAHYTPTFTDKISERLPSGANAMIAIPHTVANAVVAQYLAGEAYVIHLIQSAPAITVKNPVMTGSRNKYATTSLLGLKEYPDAFNLETEWTGEDLRLGRLSLIPRHTACGSDMVCEVKRAGLEALATSLTRLLRAQYKDIPLRSVILQDALSVKLNGREVRVHAQVLRAEATATDLVLYTKLTLNIP
ncbi:MAG TPA: hypothetical protein VJV04_08070 [Nitrospiraceae bacterium]|nr:hypothetical protein [Nitrospiraceae bacterium]